MSGVWVFKDGVFRRYDGRGGADPGDSRQPSGSRRKVLVHIPTNEVIASYEMLEPKLLEAGWQRYELGNPDMIQFHKPPSVHLISLPRDFRQFSTIHMYDIVVKVRNVFEVRDM